MSASADALTLVLFDDEVAARWEPFALTRPAGELLFGTMTLRARAERVFGARCVAHLAAEHLQGFAEGDAPAVLHLADSPADGERLFLSSRAVPGWESGELWRERRGGAGALLIGDEVVGWYAPEGTPAPDAGFFASPGGLLDRTGAVVLPGTTISHVWELMSLNPGQIATDVAALFPDASTALPAGAYAFGTHPVVVGPGATVEPGVVFDTTAGPVWLDEGSHVRAFSRVAGPVYLGRGSTILGGTVEQSSIGPVSKIRGELAESVVLGWVNKAHDGHIGHAYLGAWVNLGAETTNSDLKNNYSAVRLWTPGGEVDTGEMKIGCFLGDHVKTGIGLLLNTGTVVGAGSNLYGAEMPPKYVPPFSWGTGAELAAYRVDRFLQVAERAMQRRGVTLTPGARQQLAAAWERARGDAASTPPPPAGGESLP
jgi:UDP-N-acetylglucosamine diphosphorylase / glucose-1-phosphate thymidylyltransferase / UDP-N-acetylgalactosamine diphosphorylase / glucosamine-1-phosphate N-acetyltransferase / galactosamine-1-phosphate N-acetyltransferase